MATDRKKRRVEYVPPVHILKKIEEHSKGNRTQFLNNAVAAYSATLEEERRQANSVRNLLK